tara:strand:+ start:191 stop:436 length:246 start_codon:yes stop_codon:yes gene_type:complete
MGEKKRGLNELRQVKDSVYKSRKTSGNYNKLGLANTMLKLGAEIIALDNKFPNNADFGAEARKCIKELINYKKDYPDPTKL